MAPLLTPRHAALGAALIAAAVYLLTMNRTLGFMDSGEVAAVASTLGIMHPTGYPTLTILGWLVTTLVPLREILVLNIFAALLAATGVGLLSLLFDYLLFSSGLLPVPTVPDEIPGERSSRRRGGSGANNGNEKSGVHEVPMWGRTSVAALSALFVGFSGIWWEQATGFEVYALQSLLLPLVTLLFVRFVDDERKRGDKGESLRRFSRDGVWFALALGLAFTNHMMTIFLAPAFLVYYFWSLGVGPRAFLRLLSLIPPFLAGLLPYLYLPIRSSMHPRFNWGRPDTWEGFVEHVSGASFREWMFSGMDVFRAQSDYFFGRLPSEFAYAGIVVAAAGLVLLAIRNARLALWSFLMFVTCAILAGNYRIYDVELYYTTAILAVGIWFCIGVGWLLQRIGTRAGVGVAALLVIANPTLHYGENDLSGNRLEEDYIYNVLMTAPEETIIFSSNAAVFVTGAWYMQGVEELRPDVTVINHDYLSNPWYLDQLADHHPELMDAVAKEVEEFRDASTKEDSGDPSDYLRMMSAYDRMVQAIIDLQMERGDVMIVGEMERAFGSSYAAVPWQLGYRLTNDTGYLAQPFPSYRFEQWDHVDPFAASIYEAYGRRLAYRASYEKEQGHDSLARRYLEYAATFDPKIDPETVERLPLDAITQVRATAEFYDRLRQRLRGE